MFCLLRKDTQQYSIEKHETKTLIRVFLSDGEYQNTFSLTASEWDKVKVE